MGLDTPTESQHVFLTRKYSHNCLLCPCRRRGSNLRSFRPLDLESDALPTEPPHHPCMYDELDGQHKGSGQLINTTTETSSVLENKGWTGTRSHKVAEADARHRYSPSDMSVRKKKIFGYNRAWHCPSNEIGQSNQEPVFFSFRFYFNVFISKYYGLASAYGNFPGCKKSHVAIPHRMPTSVVAAQLTCPREGEGDMRSLEGKGKCVYWLIISKIPLTPRPNRHIIWTVRYWRQKLEPWPLNSLITFVWHKINYPMLGECFRKDQPFLTDWQ